MPDHSSDPVLPVVQQGLAVVVPSDFALDRELWRWAPTDVSLHLTRLPFLDLPVTVELAVACAEFGPLRQATLDVLTPQPDVVAYACASGSFVGGAAGEADLVATMLDAGAPAACTTSGALVEALHALGVESVAVGAPYIDSVIDPLVGFLADSGIRVTAWAGLGLVDNIWRVDRGAVINLAESLDTADADAVFLSCTNLPTYDAIEPLERALGKPVVTANQVTMWTALQRMGKKPSGPGRLMDAQPADLAAGVT